MFLPRIVAGLALACTVQSLASPALAARVAPLIPHMDPPASAELRDRFHDALMRGLQQGGSVDVVTSIDVRTRLSERTALASCTSVSCLPQVAQELKAERLALADIAVSGKTYTISLRLTDQGGAEMWQTVERCDICSLREADEAIGRGAARMIPWINRPGPTDQAKVELKPLPPKPVALAPPTTKQPAPPPLSLVLPANRRQHWTPYRYAWVTAVVVGGLAVAGAVPFLAYAAREDEITCPAPTDRKSCPTIYRGNLGAGLGLLLGGIGLGGGGFAAFYALDRREQRRTSTRVTLMPISGGALGGVGGQF